MAAKAVSQTFKTFLESYLRDLYQTTSVSMKVLATKSDNECPQGREVLYLYALETGKLPLLISASKGSSVPILGYDWNP